MFETNELKNLILFLNRVSTTGLDEAKELLKLASKIKSQIDVQELKSKESEIKEVGPNREARRAKKV